MITGWTPGQHALVTCPRCADLCRLATSRSCWCERCGWSSWVACPTDDCSLVLVRWSSGPQGPATPWYCDKPHWIQGPLCPVCWVPSSRTDGDAFACPRGHLYYVADPMTCRRCRSGYLVVLVSAPSGARWRCETCDAPGPPVTW